MMKKLTLSCLLGCYFIIGYGGEKDNQAPKENQVPFEKVLQALEAENVKKYEDDTEHRALMKTLASQDITEKITDIQAALLSIGLDQIEVKESLGPINNRFKETQHQIATLSVAVSANADSIMAALHNGYQGITSALKPLEQICTKILGNSNATLENSQFILSKIKEVFQEMKSIRWASNQTSNNVDELHEKVDVLHEKEDLQNKKIDRLQEQMAELAHILGCIGVTLRAHAQAQQQARAQGAPSSLSLLPPS